MKIAILEDDQKILNRIRQKIDKIFEISFYQNTDEFLKVCQNFDLVLIGKNFINKDLVDKISRYKLEIGLLNKGEVDFDDEHIAIVLDEEGIEQIAEKLKYFEVKIRIQSLVDVESKSLNDIQKIAEQSEFLRKRQKKTEEFLKKIVKSDYYFEEKEGIGILEIRELLTQTEKDEVWNALKNVNFNVAMYFSLNRISSVYLNILIHFWKEVKKFNGKLVYWNRTKNIQIISLFKLCKLDNIIDMVDNFEDVKIKLNKN